MKSPLLSRRGLTTALSFLVKLVSSCNREAEIRGRQNVYVAKDITCEFCRELHLAILCSALLQNYMYVFKGSEVWKNFFFETKLLSRL